MIDYSNDISNIKSVDNEGGIFLYPTDTVWGLGASVSNFAGIEKISQIKQRAADQRFILLVNSIEMLKAYVDDIPPKIQTLMAYFNRPLTVIYKAAESMDPRIAGVDGSIAIRLVSNDFLNQLIKSFGCPIISTSANFKGALPSSDFQELDSELVSMVDYSVKNYVKSSKKPTPSAIVKLDKAGELVFIRE